MTRKESLDILDAVYKQMDSMSDDEFFNYMTEHSSTFKKRIQDIESKEQESTAAQENNNQNISINVCDVDILVADADLSSGKLYMANKTTDINYIGDNECQMAA